MNKLDSKITVLLNNDNEALIINMNKKRIIYFNQEYDITLNR